jgi:hypothetical protein
MNRRKFFGFLAVAPVAVPAVMAAKPAYASGGVVKGQPTYLFGDYHSRFGCVDLEAYVPIPSGRIPVHLARIKRIDGQPIRITAETEGTGI